nr:ribonuclease H-like domain-containing protein [Tanacetum cinerariifolium]
LFKKVSDQKDNTHDTSVNTKFAKQPIMENLSKVGETNALSKPVTSNSVSTPQESKDNTKTRRPQPRSNTKNDRVPFASTNSQNKNKEAEVEEHHRNLLLSKNKKHMSSTCNNFTLDSQNVYSKVVCAMCKQCLISVNHDECLLNYVNDKNSRGKKQTGNILITRLYFIKGLGHNLFSVGQFCDSDLKVAFRRNACFVKNLEGVDLLKGDRSTNLYTINLHEMASASPICLMARASFTKSWLWHQRLSHLNFNTINDLARNDLVSGLPKFKYHKEHICPSFEQGKSKRASHPPKPVPNLRQRLHLLHMDLCGPMRIASINGKLITVLLQSPVIIIRTDNGTEFTNQVLKEYFDTVGISHQMSSIRTPQQNGVVERRNRTLVEAARTMLIFSRAPLFLWAEAIATACVFHSKPLHYSLSIQQTPYELINDRKPDISFLHVFGALCYHKNDREDIGKLGAKVILVFSLGVDNTKTRRPQPRSNTKNDRVPSTSKSSRSKNKEAEVEEHHRNLLLSKNNKHMSSTCNKIKTDSQEVISNVACAMCSKCLISVNHDKCLCKLFNQECKIVDSSESKSKSDCSNGDNACTSNTMEPKIKRFPNSTSLLDRKPDISSLHVFDALCYPKNDREDIRKLGAKGDIGFFIGSKPRLNSMTSGHISSDFDLTYAPSTITMQQPSEGELDLLFEAMYDDYIGGQPSATARTIPPVQEPQVRQSSTTSTTIADTAPIPTNSSSHATNILITLQDVNELNPNVMVDGNTFVNPFANPSTSVPTASSSQQNVNPSNMHMFYQPYPHKFQWTKDHPLQQVIEEPSRPVLTRNQLRSDGDMCMYALSVSTMEPKNVKEAMTDPPWIDLMQEELFQFKRLDVWVLVPAPDNISPLTLKWLFKNK